MRKIDYLVVHCSATVEGKHITAEDIDRWHKQRGWSGIGYHYVILLDGTVQEGRPEAKIGAHVKGYNKNSIGVCYIGGLSKNKAPKDTRTPAQKAALEQLLIDLKDKYPNAEIRGHRDFSKDLNGNGVIEPFEFSKACPSYNAYQEYKDLCS
jgi:N-acetyl-anhydromuramyl-L-alanine amidase AmpD